MRHPRHWHCPRQRRPRRLCRPRRLFRRSRLPQARPRHCRHTAVLTTPRSTSAVPHGASTKCTNAPASARAHCVSGVQSSQATPLNPPYIVPSPCLPDPDRRPRHRQHHHRRCPALQLHRPPLHPPRAPRRHGHRHHHRRPSPTLNWSPPSISASRVATPRTTSPQRAS